jgi:predicted nucleic acid-binding protein
MSRQFNTPSSASGEIEDDAPSPDYIVIDASVWVSRLVHKDVFHQVVKAWMEKQRSEGVIFLSPALLLSEVAGAISRRTGEPHLARNAIASLIHLPGLRLVEMDQSLVQGASRLAADLGLRGADSFYVAVAARLNLPLITLDEDQKDKADSVIAVHTLDKPM